MLLPVGEGDAVDGRRSCCAVARALAGSGRGRRAQRQRGRLSHAERRAPAAATGSRRARPRRRRRARPPRRALPSRRPRLGEGDARPSGARRAERAAISDSTWRCSSSGARTSIDRTKLDQLGFGAWAWLGHGVPSACKDSAGARSLPAGHGRLARRLRGLSAARDRDRAGARPRPARASARGASPASGVSRSAHLLAGPEQPGRDRRLAHAQRARRFAVGEAEDVDGHEREAKVLGQLGDRRVDLLDLERLLGLAHAAAGRRATTSSSVATVTGRRPAVRRLVRNVLRSTRIR